MSVELSQLPIVLSSFTFSDPSEAPAAELMLKAKHHLLAPGQHTVPKSNNSYWGVLNETGIALLNATKGRLHEAKATLKGSLKISRTGGKHYKDGSIDLCTWENRQFFGQYSGDPDHEVTTSIVRLYEIDKDGNGWVLTVSGSIYLVSR